MKFVTVRDVQKINLAFMLKVDSQKNDVQQQQQQQQQQQDSRLI
jgi:hypothetical protein